MDQKNIKKIVLAYSGGLDTSIIIPWLKENYNNPEIIAVAGDVGQNDELEGLEEKAIKTGASKLYVMDLVDEMVDDVIIPSMMMGAKYEDYLLGTAFARPIIAKGLVERIGIEGSNVKQSSAKGEIVFNAPLKNHAEAMEYIVKALTDKEKGVISDMKQIDAVGHRVLHGGASFTESQVVNPKVMEAIYDNIILGPLHNPANIQGIEACQKMMP